MRQAVITQGGQVSIPADVRRRWGTTRVIVEDRGDSLVLRPLPDDPIDAAMGSLAGPGLTAAAIGVRLIPLPDSSGARPVVGEADQQG